MKEKYNIQRREKHGPALFFQKLNASQIRWVYKTIRDKDPQQLKFEFALWTRQMIVTLIKHKFGLKLSPTSVGRLLHQLGFSCQKPLYRAYQRDKELVEKWKKEEFPKIQKRAKKEGAVIFFQDESGIRSDFHSGKTWALKGQTPVIEATGARFGLNMIAAITPRGEMNFMIVHGYDRPWYCPCRSNLYFSKAVDDRPRPQGLFDLGWSSNA